MILLIVGVVLLLIGIALYIGSAKTIGKLNAIQSTDLSKIKNILENFEGLSNAHGAGNFSLFTKMNGKAFSTNPIHAEFTKKPCVYYRVLLEQEYETLVITENKEGNPAKRWERKTKKLIDTENKVLDFLLKDETGEIPININDSGLKGIVSYSKFEKEPPNTSIFNIEGFNLMNGTNSKTIGYRYEESMIPIGQPLFVLGDANDRNGKLMVSAPVLKENPFIVSTQTEDEIRKAIKRSAANTKIGGIIAVVIGVGLCIYALLKWYQWV